MEVAPVRPEEDGEELFRALDAERVWEHLPFQPPYPDALDGPPAGPLDLGHVPVGDASAGALRVAARRSRGGDVQLPRRIGTTTPGSRSAPPPTDRRCGGPLVNPDTKLLLLGYAFDELHVGRVQLKTDVRNTRSQRAIARLGARYEANLGRYQRRSDGTVRDTVLFSILAEDWPRVRAGLEGRLEQVSD